MVEIKKIDINEIHQKEDKLHKLLEDNWYLKKYPETKIKYVDEWNFAILSRSWNVSLYMNEKWEIIFNIWTISENYFYKISQLLSGYVERKNEQTGEYELYRIKTINWKPYILWLEWLVWGNLNNINIWVWEQVDKLSKDYYDVFIDIIFYTEKLWLNVFKHEPNEWEKRTVFEENVLWLFTKNWVIRIKDLVSLLEYWQLSGWKAMFDEFLPKVREKLLSQIWDKRFQNVWDVVTLEEIQNYYENWLIDRDLYLICVETLVDLWRLDKKILDKLKSEIQPDLDTLKREISKDK